MAGITGDLNATPSNWYGYPDRPVERVSWDDVQIFLERLNTQEEGNIPPGWKYTPYLQSHSGNMPAGQVQALLIPGEIQLVQVMQTGTMVRTPIDQWKLVCTPPPMPGVFMT